MFDGGKYSTAEGDGGSAGEEDSDAGEKGELSLSARLDAAEDATDGPCSCQLQIDEQQKENERIWAAVRRSALQQTGCDNNGNHRSDPTPGDGAGVAHHGARFAGASV